MARLLFRTLTGVAAVVAIGLALPGAASASGDGASGQISDVKTSDGVIQFVFTAKGLPAGSALKPDSVVVQAGDVTLPATAAIGSTGTVRSGKAPLRESMIVLDTSGSMAGDGIKAARQAALAYVEALPADVRIGLVAFSDQPHVVQRPTTNRATLRDAIQTVRAGGSTSLYDGVMTAVQTLGRAPSGAQLRMLVLSDGNDTASTHSVSDAIASATAANVPVDVVAFRLPGRHAILDQLASSSHGRVLPAQSANDLANVFTSAAAEFQSQVLVTAQVPAEIAGQTQQLVVTMNSQAQTVTADLTLKLPGTSEVQRGIGPAITKAQAGSSSNVKLSLVLGLAFLVMFALAMLAVWVPVEGRARANARERLAEVSRYRVLAAVGREQAAVAATPTEGSVTTATLSFLDRFLRSGGRRQTVVERLERAGLRIRPEEWVAFQVAAVLVTAALIAVLSRHIIGVPVGGLLGYLATQAFLRIKTSRRSRAFNDQLPDVLQLVAGSLRSGFSLNQAVAAVVREGNEPTASEIARALTEVRLGSDLEDALDRVSERMQCPDLHWVVLAVRISREVGGNLAEVIMNTVGTMRERAQVRGQIRVLSAEGRISARILIALPFVLTGYLLAFRPGYLHPLYTTGVGIALVAGGAVLLALGAFWITRLVKIEV